jgi:hypothetical protein
MQYYEGAKSVKAKYRKRKVFEDNMSAFIYQKPRKVYANTELTNQIAQG